MTKGITFEQRDGAGLRIALVVAEWNSGITYALRDGAQDALVKSGVDDVTTISVPGSYELVYATKQLVESGRYDAIIAIGCLIKGETMHFEYIADAVSHGLMQLNIEGNIPIIFGLLTCLTEEQAIDRSSGDNNHGYGWGLSAVQMSLLRKKFPS